MTALLGASLNPWTIEFLLGAQAMCAAAIGLIFLRHWRRMRDPLLLCFALAFWLLATNWTALAFVDRDEPQTVLYTVRLAAFIVIIVGVWLKNRGKRTA